MITVAGVDLGASSGRVVVADVSRRRLDLQEVHRFPNGPVDLPDGLHWDALSLYSQTLGGLRAAAAAGAGPLASVGIDSWAVDYGLIGADGALLGNPFHYRDLRTDQVADVVHHQVDPHELYVTTGVQFLPFTTIYQLAADRPALTRAQHLLLMADLLAYWLTGELGTEVTNASTTGLYDVRRGDWAWEVADRVGVARHLLGTLRSPGQVVGPLREAVRREVPQAAATVVTAVASHDTASGVLAVPAADERFAYISCGTWSLVGVELDGPVLTEASRLANVTNELGVDTTVRYLRNVMGLWLLSESIETWRRARMPVGLSTLLTMASEVPRGGPVVDPDDPAFLPPGDMPSRIAEACRRTGVPVPVGQARVVRCILDSLAAAYARTLREVSALSGRTVDVVHLVGGGARNSLLCQLTADACGLPVVAGPVEATALGNVLVQARAHGAVAGDRWDLRALVRATQPVRRYEPRPLRRSVAITGGARSPRAVRRPPR